MTRKARRLLFIWAVALFVLLSTGVLVFAFGFRYDFQNKSLVKTGSIVLKPNVESQIFINNKLEGSTSFLNSTFSKKRLLPGTYSVKVVKDKYFTWEKKVEVKEGLVSDFSHVILFNRHPAEPPVVAKKAPFSFDKLSGQMVYLEKGVLSFYNLNEEQPFFRTEPIFLDQANLKIIWGVGTKEALAYDQTKTVYFNLNNKTFRFLGSPKQFSLTASSLREGQLYFLKPVAKPLLGQDLVSLSLSQLKTKVISKHIVSFLIAKDEIFAVSGHPNRFLKMGLDGSNEKILGELNLDGLGGLTVRRVENRDETYFVLIGSGLYSFKESKLDLLAKNVRDFSISPNNNILGWHTDREFFVEWLKDTDYQPLKKAGEKELVAAAGNILGFNWYKNSDYVFLESAGSLKAIEVDLRGGANSFSLFNLSAEERAWYDLSQNKIFKLSSLYGLAVVDLP